MCAANGVRERTILEYFVAANSRKQSIDLHSALACQNLGKSLSTASPPKHQDHRRNCWLNTIFQLLDGREKAVKSKKTDDS